MQLTAIRNTAHVLLCGLLFSMPANAETVPEFHLLAFSSETLNQSRSLQHFDFDPSQPDRLQLKEEHTSKTQRQAVQTFARLMALPDPKTARLITRLSRQQLPDNCLTEACRIPVQTLSCTKFDLLPGETFSADGSYIIDSAIAPECMPTVILITSAPLIPGKLGQCDDCVQIDHVYQVRYLRGHFGQAVYQATPQATPVITN